MGERVGRVTQTRGPRNRVQSEMHCIAFIISFDLWSIRAISIYPGRSARTLNFPANLPTYLPTGEISNTRLRVSAGNQDIPSREELTSIHPLGRGPMEGASGRELRGNDFTHEVERRGKNRSKNGSQLIGGRGRTGTREKLGISYLQRSE